jgi:hypothetical protein
MLLVRAFFVVSFFILFLNWEWYVLYFLGYFFFTYYVEADLILLKVRNEGKYL